MFQIETAGLVIRIENRYHYVKTICEDYFTSDDRPADFIVSATEEEIKRELEKTIFASGKSYGEGIVICEKISNALPAFDAFVMHSSVVEVDGKAYCFAAESGTGKSTHTRYWKELLGDRLTVINGDKPIYRFQSDRLMAYGSPWCGKEGWQTNTSAPLAALCLLERGEEDAVFPVDAFELFGEMSHHFYMVDRDQVDLVKLMQLIDRMVTTVPVYRLRCRNNVSAAETALKYFGIAWEEKK